MTSWTETTLHNKIHVKHGFPFKSEYFASEGDYIVLTPGNFYEEGGFKQQQGKEKFYKGTFLESYLLKKGDLIVAMTEQAEGLLGSTAIIPLDDLYLHNQRLGLITVDENKIDRLFIYHLFKSDFIREQIQGSSSGSKVKHTSPERIYNLKVYLPSVEEQKKIAAVLSALDAKIELNNRINAELENLAKTIYDYWFVQFDFPYDFDRSQPDEHGKPYKSSGGKMVWSDVLDREIPAGWEIGTLGNWIDFKRGISYKSNQIQDTGIPLLNLNSFTLSGKFKPEGTKYFNGSFKENSKLNHGDLVVAITDVTRNATIIGKSFVVPNLFEEQPLMSCDVACIISKSNLNNYYLEMLFNSERYHEYIKHFASGTLVLHLDLNGMLWFKTFMPPKKLLDRFSEFKRGIIEKQTINIIENQQLTQLRDWLLPMLMNGQVRIK
jgi:type I restriction enzyme, S subunit